MLCTVHWEKRTVVYDLVEPFVSLTYVKLYIHNTHTEIFPNGLSAVRLQRVECWLAAIHSIHIIYYMFIEYERGVELISTAVDVFAEPACECGFCSRFQYKHWTWTFVIFSCYLTYHLFDFMVSSDRIDLANGIYQLINGILLVSF